MEFFVFMIMHPPSEARLRIIEYQSRAFGIYNTIYKPKAIKQEKNLLNYNYY